MSTGFVVIGRNEGERLTACLESVAKTGWPIVYVDSGSVDGSTAAAVALGASVVDLDLSIPFTAARARNAGLRELVAAQPEMHHVCFIDGDCVLVGEWLERAHAFMQANDDVAIVCGRRQERRPDASVYNALCDREWARPAGETRACGGDCLARIDALRSVGGFRDSLIAGEEPELCVRLRQKGWKIWRLDAVMTLHDAAMSRFQQWWRRMVRGGHAYGEVSLLHFGAAEAIWRREAMRALFWGFLLPLAIFVLTFLNPWFLAAPLAYPLQVVRIAIREGWRKPESWTYAWFMMLAKFAECYGILRFYLLRLFHVRSGIIEYK